MKLYRVICKVDNGVSITEWSSIVCATDKDQAADLLLRYWNSQYDTSAKVLYIGEVSIDTSRILMTKESYK